MAKNFYLVLGVSRDAAPSQIRKAYRQLVRIHHPDAKTGSTDRFTEIQEAYETLADEKAKQTYDQSLPQEYSPRHHAPRRWTTEPSNEHRAKPIRRKEPLPNEAQKRQTYHMAPSRFETMDEFLNGWVPGSFMYDRPPHRTKELYLEIILDREEATRGGRFPLEIPIRKQCSTCRGTGIMGLFICSVCRGQGGVHGTREVEIFMPPHVANGTETRLSLAHVGLPDVELYIRVSVP